MEKPSKLILLLFIPLLAISTIALFLVRDIPFINMRPDQDEWAIGIAELYYQNDKLEITFPKSVKNPVFTSAQVSGLRAYFVADPFLIHDNNLYYLFFETMSDRKGNIAVAVSSDARHWQYKGVALNEPFHLSYPHILQLNGSFYMTPESSTTNSIRLYISKRFPFDWLYLKDIVVGKPFVDPTLFYHNGNFYLFASDISNSNLYLYVAKQLEGHWIEHPKSPLIQNDKTRSRPAGNILEVGNKLIRPTQDDTPYYGKRIKLFEITKLTPEDYQEKEIDYSSLLSNSGKGWDKDGKHNISAVQTNKNKWLCAIDGKRNINNIVYIGNLRLRLPTKFINIFLHLRRHK